MLSLKVDGAQLRPSGGRVAVLAVGSNPGADGGRVPGWSAIFGQNVWYDGITYTGMLLPAPLDPAWSTTGTGIYSRLRYSDYTGLSPIVPPDSPIPGWVEFTGKFGGDWYLQSVGLNEAAKTATSYGKNRGFYLSWATYGAIDDDWVQLECGWSNTGDGSAGPSLRFWLSGKVELWRDGALYNVGSIKGSQHPGSIANANVNVLLIPCRFRELLVVSNQGGGFSTAFDDIVDGETDPIVTPDEAFWWYVPYGQVTVQCAPLQYASSGYLCSVTEGLAEPPTGDPAYRTFWDLPYAGSTCAVTPSVVSQGDPGTPYDGVALQCRMRFDLTGETGYTPFLQAGIAEWAAPTASTDDSAETELLIADGIALPYVTRLAVNVPDSPAGVEIDLTIRDPDATGVAKLDTLANRPWALLNDTAVVVQGRNDPFRRTWTANAEADTIEGQIRDPWKALENYRFRDPLILDELSIEDALKAVILPAVPDATFQVTSDPFTIPRGKSISTGEFAAQVQPGATSADWVQRIMETYAGNWWYGFKRGTLFWALSPEDMDAADPIATLYESAADAIADGVTFEELQGRLCRATDSHALEPECNDVRVTGWDPLTQRPFVTHYPDAASQDPTLAPADRPDNHLGEPRYYGYGDPGLQTQDACDRAATLLFDRLTVVRHLREDQAETQVWPDGHWGWRGENLRIHGKGLYRIVSLSTDVDKEPVDDDPWQWRECRYVLERRGD